MTKTGPQGRLSEFNLRGGSPLRKCGGEGEIRTLDGPVTHNGFRDRGDDSYSKRVRADRKRKVRNHLTGRNLMTKRTSSEAPWAGPARADQVKALRGTRAFP